MKHFDAVSAAKIARQLIHTGRDAALGTLDKDGAPNVSHIAAATLSTGRPVLLMSDLAVHTHNVRRDSRASLLFVAAEGDGEDTNTRARLTLSGTIQPADDRAYARSRFVRRHPDAEMYVDFGDMHLMAFQPLRAYLVAGFGRITTVALADLIADAEAEKALASVDEGACQHMDEDHLDALAAMAGAPAEEGAWKSAGCDPKGIDLVGPAGVTRRAEFDRPIASSGELRVALKKLTDRCRAEAETR